MSPVLSLRGLSVRFGTSPPAVNSLDLDLQAGECLALVGESGCGKSVTARAIMGLLDARRVKLNWRSLSISGLNSSPRVAANRRGLAMIFQEPATALDPLFTVGWQLTRAIRRRLGSTQAEAQKAALDALSEAGFPEPEDTFQSYPGTLSGGMRQLVMIAMAIAVRPNVLIADEPTTALDVTTQQWVLSRLDTLRQKQGTAMLLISHDLGVVAKACDRILIMYCGKAVEQCSYREFFRRPRHPYSAGLIKAVPRLSGALALPIPGQLPSAAEQQDGCAFAPRCPHRSSSCHHMVPALEDHEGRSFACHHPL